VERIMVRIGLEFDVTPEDLSGAVAVIEAILTTTRDGDQSTTTDTQAEAVEDWFAHLGAGSRSFWEIAAQYAQTHPTWTFEELAAESGIDKEKLRSYHRNSYRAIKDEDSDDPLSKKWDVDNARYVYTMHDAVRDEILRLADGE
jgi:hypothetical protein